MGVTEIKSRNVAEIPAQICKKIKYIFTDIDDTITSDGIISASAFEAIWELYNAGIKIVPVTGRPAGWCDHIARMWPVEGIIGENGAFYYSYDRKNRKMKRVYLLSEKTRVENQKKLIEIGKRIEREVPGSKIAADQPFRISDLAIDYCEDTGPLGKAEVQKICKIMIENGAKYKISSIHVNCWFGNYDKVECLKKFLKDKENKNFEEMLENIVFIGDSPNDEPMFKELKTTIAVANINNFLDELDYYPLYITKKQSGEGFKEAVEVILSGRGKPAE